MTCYCQNEGSIRSGYADSLKVVRSEIRSHIVPHDSLIEFCIPENRFEANLFYGVETESRPEFAALDARIISLVQSGRMSLIRRYLLAWQYADGYFAEEFYEEVMKLAKKSPALFCEATKGLPDTAIVGLEEPKKAAGCP